MKKERKSRPYTEQDIEQIIELRGSGLSEKKIAEAIGRPYNSVHCKIKELRQNGRLPLIRDITPLTPEDIEELAVKHQLSVDDVERVIEIVGSRLLSKKAFIDEALLQWQVQGSLCAYYGVGISMVASTTLPTRACLSTNAQGKPMWISLMAKKMRGKLSHEMFLKSVATIYKHVFTHQM